MLCGVMFGLLLSRFRLTHIKKKNAERPLTLQCLGGDKRSYMRNQTSTF